MGIDSESDIAANLQIGPTTSGMVRIYIEAEGVDLPLDFDPDEADEIAEELRTAAQAARAIAAGGTRGGGDVKSGGKARKPR
jgi:phage tail sheath gpL-like